MCIYMSVYFVGSGFCLYHNYSNQPHYSIKAARNNSLPSRSGCVQIKLYFLKQLAVLGTIIC